MREVDKGVRPKVALDQINTGIEVPEWISTGRNSSPGLIPVINQETNDETRGPVPMHAHRLAQQRILQAVRSRRLFAALTVEPARPCCGRRLFANRRALMADSRLLLPLGAPGATPAPRLVGDRPYAPYVMESGRLALAGSATQLLHDPQVQRACLVA